MNKTLSKTILSALLAGVVMTSGATLSDYLARAEEAVGAKAKTYAAMYGRKQLEDKKGNKIYTNKKGQIFIDKYGRKVDSDENYDEDSEGNPIFYKSDTDDTQFTITTDGKVEQL